MRVLGKASNRRWGDHIRSACATNPLSAYGKRDSSFIPFTFWKDKNETRRNLPVELVPETGYGRLDFILAIMLPPNPRFNIDAPKVHILAHITEAKGTEGNATTKLVSYTQLGRSFVLDITAVENVVGRVETKGGRLAGEWVIVDRSQGLCQTGFHPEEPEFEGEGD
ncbi:hypothetical protein FRC10_006404 [Ceratobasidium sp. 414]|nr:hypothetical protein FRC10_006404 [Ceratobasidium sp. 414]